MIVHFRRYHSYLSIDLNGGSRNRLCNRWNGVSITPAFTPTIWRTRIIQKTMALLRWGIVEILLMFSIGMVGTHLLHRSLTGLDYRYFRSRFVLLCVTTIDECLLVDRTTTARKPRRRNSVPIGASLRPMADESTPKTTTTTTTRNPLLFIVYFPSFVLQAFSGIDD